MLFRSKNLLDEVKVFFKTKKELDKYTTKENLLHQGYVAEIEPLEKPILKEFIKENKDITFLIFDESTILSKVDEQLLSSFKHINQIHICFILCTLNLSYTHGIFILIFTLQAVPSGPSPDRGSDLDI